MNARFMRFRTAIALSVAVVLLALLMRLVTEAFAVPSSSMEPTLLPGDHVLVTRFVFAQPQRGDIVVFASATGEGTMIKRVMGLPGESIRVRAGHVIVNGVELAEDYVSAADEVLPRTESVHVVPRDHLFLLGDNRGHSEDSRAFGFVRRDAIVGRARFIYWSVSSNRYPTKVRWNRLFHVVE